MNRTRRGNPAEVSRTPPSDVPLFGGTITDGWEPMPATPHPATENADVAERAAEHRQALSARFPESAIVVPSGHLVTRANDMPYPFRPSSWFAWLTGEPAAESVLVMTPTTTGHHARLFIRTNASPGTPDYFLDPLHGGAWTGTATSTRQTAAALRISTRDRRELRDSLAELPGSVLLLRGQDPLVDEALPEAHPGALPLVLDELRLIKDESEVRELRRACAATARGFADIVRELPLVTQDGFERGERWLEGTFWRRARLEGNDVGYTSIVAAGRHGTALHWWRNDGAVRPGQLLLADMGVETDQFYTADVTRTLPVDGIWSEVQLRVYRAVLEAQEAAVAESVAGADFEAGHFAAMWVLADHLHHWGLITASADDCLSPDLTRPGAGAHRRYTLHRTSHMLGLDVHDCAQARSEDYELATLRPGMTMTVEPGLYFQTNDTTVPGPFQGLAVRIEDDYVVSEGKPVHLSDDVPRDPAALLGWMSDCLNSTELPQ